MFLSFNTLTQLQFNCGVYSVGQGVHRRPDEEMHAQILVPSKNLGNHYHPPLMRTLYHHSLESSSSICLIQTPLRLNQLPHSQPRLQQFLMLFRTHQNQSSICIGGAQFHLDLRTVIPSFPSISLLALRYATGTILGPSDQLTQIR